MFDLDIIKLAWMSLWRRKLRTILTMIGIMIGTAGIVIMISLGAGLERSVVGELEGTNMTNIEVYPGYEVAGSSQAEQVTKLTKDSVMDLKGLSGVKAVTPMVTSSGEINIGRDQIGVNFVGIDMSVAKEMGYELTDGRFPRSNEILLGNSVVQDIIKTTGKDNIIRKPVNIITTGISKEGQEPEEFQNRSRITGTLGQSGGTEDYSAIMDIDTLIEIMGETSGETNIIDSQGYSNIRIVAEDTDTVEELSKEINEMGYMAYSTQEMLDSIGSVFKFLQIFLGGIGSIALLVAAIGITNTMIMSIYERTKEIGVNKVIGASVKDVRMQFLYEASFIGLMGGVAGLVFSFLVTLLINFIAGLYIGAQSGVTENFNLAYIPPWLAIFAITFSIIVGILSGLYPANRAAKISVLEALRQE